MIKNNEDDNCLNLNIEIWELWNRYNGWKLKKLYRIRIKVRWCRDSILWKKFWKFIPHTFAHPCTPTHICSHPPIPTNTHPNLPTPSPYQPTPAYTYAHLSMLHTHPRSPAHTCAYLCTPTFTCTHPHTPQTCPLMLILVWSIICKLANTKKARRYKERKRKEQESAEAFQRTNSNPFYKLEIYMSSMWNIQMVHENVKKP